MSLCLVTTLIWVENNISMHSGGARLKYKGGSSYDKDFVSSKYYVASIYYG
jgi:hypothetical protein